LVHAFIEITPFDTVKFEVDKETGYLRVDRPQRSSALPPAPYGFIPRTYCGAKVGAMSPKAERGDGDPLDICVLSERPINRSEIVLEARILGGLQMVDAGEADDKIVAVLDNDRFWMDAKDINDIPEVVVERLRHYFLTYKLIPGQPPEDISIDLIFGTEHAYALVEAARQDYDEGFGDA
jgi:inorganic pyrophosphatase